MSILFARRAIVVQTPARPTTILLQPRRWPPADLGLELCATFNPTLLVWRVRRPKRQASSCSDNIAPERIGRIPGKIVLSYPAAPAHRADSLQILKNLRFGRRISAGSSASPARRRFRRIRPPARKCPQMRDRNPHVISDASRFLGAATIQRREICARGLPIAPPLRDGVERVRHCRLRGTGNRAQPFRRPSAVRLRNTMRRELGSSIAAAFSRWVRVRETVSIVSPR